MTAAKPMTPEELANARLVALREARRKRLRTAAARAPRHPRAPETALRHATARLLLAFHADVRRAVLALAPAALARRSARADAAADPLAKSTLRSLLDSNQYRLVPYRQVAARAAKRTAQSVADQTATALGLDAHGFSFDADAAADEAVQGVADAMGDSIDRASDALDEWTDLDPDRSPRAGDVDALGGMIDDVFGGVVGRAVAGASLLFGYLFGSLVETSQREAGVSSYVWLTMHDSHVRPAHAALDGVVADWDDPPLKAEDADIEEDVHPGEDYNCRCVASPIAPDET